MSPNFQDISPWYNDPSRIYDERALTEAEKVNSVREKYLWKFFMVTSQEAWIEEIIKEDVRMSKIVALPKGTKVHFSWEEDVHDNSFNSSFFILEVIFPDKSRQTIKCTADQAEQLWEKCGSMSEALYRVISRDVWTILNS